MAFGELRVALLSFLVAFESFLELGVAFGSCLELHMSYEKQASRRV